MAYSAVIFDLFGTLAEFSALAHDRVLTAMAEALDLPPQEFGQAWQTAYLAQERGTLPAMEDALQQISTQIGRPQADAKVAKASQLYRDFQRRTLTPRPEALPMLAFLRQAGYATGLISNCPAIAADLWPESSLAPLIDVAIFSCLVGLLKPDPRIYRLACERLGIAADRCLYVGDGGSRELSGAVACGMDAVQLQPCDEDPDDARLLGRQRWSGRTIHLLSDIRDLLSQAA
jgi:putative hydrolase of the HAD superfamily